MTDLEIDITGCQTWDEMVTKYQEQIPDDEGNPMTHRLQMTYSKRKNAVAFGGGQRSSGVTNGSNTENLLLTQYLKSSYMIFCFTTFVLFNKLPNFQ
ncbi:hypothetical protein HOLleu_00783 [Holothuria leucospilota]|uniref:Uncharacterized protein n=1 Tax=Holothuria leucospilota TaxID=206669 RepID=A0A9Q1CPF5_HOLLE|nr:hypothetical protein HOLleu_00783 [Holothuria leucospilota]